MREYLKTIGLSLIPTILIYIGKTEGFFNFLKEHNFIKSDADIKSPQFWCFIIGVIWAGLIIPVQFANTKNKLKEKEDDFDELLKFNKEIYFKATKDKIKKQSVDFRTRIFVPEKGIEKYWKRFRHKKKEFHLKHYKSISDALNSKSLHFEVNPNIQGMVGKTYSESKIFIDFDVQKADYNLTPYQKSKTNDVKFCSTIPIFNKENEIKAILSVDSDKEVVLKDSEFQEWQSSLMYYGVLVDKHLKL
nr:hypothetical protein [uncultured Flavobacterium sp.]